MAEPVWTSDRRRTTVVALFFGLGFGVRSIADELEMSFAKVLAILEEHAANELACDQTRALVGPFMPVGAAGTGGAL